MFGLYITIGLCFTAGLVIFARYFDCDPVTTKVSLLLSKKVTEKCKTKSERSVFKETVSTADQLLPLFVMDVLGEYRGLPGIFVAGITSASLR